MLRLRSGFLRTYEQLSKVVNTSITYLEVCHKLVLHVLNVPKRNPNISIAKGASEAHAPNENDFRKCILNIELHLTSSRDPHKFV